jgi:hypothetical protein
MTHKNEKDDLVEKKFVKIPRKKTELGAGL